jgi:hypothetical protein
MLMRELPFDVTPPGERRLRDLAVALLRLASRALDALAHRVAVPVPMAVTEPQLEFHGDAGAPEGALYVDGRLVGHVLGVTRL